MKILIDIPEEFAVDYRTDRFKEFFNRAVADMDVMCGKYERETADMLSRAFEGSRPYELDKAVEQMEKLADKANDKILEAAELQQYYDGYEDGVRTAIEIAKDGGANEKKV